MSIKIWSLPGMVFEDIEHRMTDEHLSPRCQEILGGIFESSKMMKRGRGIVVMFPATVDQIQIIIDEILRPQERMYQSEWERCGSDDENYHILYRAIRSIRAFIEKVES